MHAWMPNGTTGPARSRPRPLVPRHRGMERLSRASQKADMRPKSSKTVRCRRQASHFFDSGRFATLILGLSRGSTALQSEIAILFCLQFDCFFSFALLHDL